MTIKSKCGLLEAKNYSYSRYRKMHCGFLVTVKTSPDPLFWSGVTINTAKYADADELLDAEFGVTVNDAISVILSKMVHGEDCKGLYMVTNWDARFKKRPKRHRPATDLLPYINKYLANPQNVYGNEHIKQEWECAICGFRGGREVWPWSKNYLFDAEYISHCPICEKGKTAEDSSSLADVSAISTKATGCDVTSKIIKGWSHHRPHVMQSGSKTKKTCENGYKGSVVLI